MDIPVVAIRAARNLYEAELKHTKGVLYSAFKKHKPGIQAEIENIEERLKELDAWLETLDEN